MATKSKRETFVSPKGTFGWSHLLKAGKFGDLDVELILNGDETIVVNDEAKNFTDFIDEQSEQARVSILAEEKDAKKLKTLKSYATHVSHKPELNDDGDETGKTIFKFKVKAEGKDPKTEEVYKNKVAIVDAKKKVMPNPRIGKGTIGKVAFQIVPFANPSSKSIGVSLKLKAVQVLELVEYGGSAANAFGEEEGYEAPDTDDSTETGDEPAGQKSGDF